MARSDTGHHFPTRFFGLSTDTKPTNAMIAATYYETDTKHELVWDGADWIRSATEVVEAIGVVAVKEERDILSVLDAILVQLKIITVHQSRQTDEELNETDIPNEVR